MNKQNFSKRVLHFGAIILLFALSSVLTAQTDSTLNAFGHFGGWPDGSAINGNHAYLIQATVLTVLDISGSGFQSVGYLTLPEEPSDIVIQDEYAYLFAAQSDSALQIVNISEPTSPKLVCRAAITSDWPVRGFISGSYVYLATDDSLKIVDVTNPNGPVLACAVAVPAYDIFVRGQLAYVGGSDGLRILDVSNPSEPKQVSFFPTSGVHGVFVEQGHAYLLGYRTEEPRLDFQVIDVADSTNPSQVGQITANVGKWLSTSGGGRIAVVDEVAYLTAANKLFIFDVSVPASPSQKGVFEHQEGLAPGFQSLQVIPPYAYAAMGTSDYGFVKIDVSDLENPTTAAVLIEPWDVTHLFDRGTILFTASQERLLAYDYADPQHPVLAGSNDKWPELYRIYVEGDTLYGVDADTLHIIDVSDPGQMVEIGSFPLPDGQTPRAVMAHDSTAYLLTINSDGSQSQLRLLDVSNLANVGVKGRYEFSGEGRDLFVPEGGTVAYLAFNEKNVKSGLQLVSILDPSAPGLLGSGETRGIPSCLWVSDTLAYVGSNDHSTGNWIVEVFNVADPSSPQQAGETSGPGLIADLEVAGHQLFASIRGGSVYQFDIIAQYHAIMLTLIAYCHSPASIYIALMYIQNMIYAFTCDGAWSLQALMASASLGVFIQMALLNPSPVEREGAPLVPLETALQQNYPNPFNPSTLIRYTLPQAVQVKLEVYNAVGQRMVVLMDEQQTAGQHEITFQGEDLPSGLYFYRLQAGNIVQEKKMLLVR